MQKVLIRVWMGNWGLASVLFLYPINTFWLRSILLCSLVFAWLGCLHYGWKKKWLRVGLLGFSLVVAGFMCCPGRDYDRKQLRDAYIRSLRAYEGTRYIWGGENGLGLDCSGLVRVALRDANFQTALKTLNPKLARHAVSLWWHDASAAALGEEYRQLTRKMVAAANLNEMDYGPINPGDIAVPLNGVHVMACLESNQWIEADPEIGKVVIVTVPNTSNPWFQEKFNVLRWRELSGNNGVEP
jgi:hypothetical protein